jgi:hypothetical protein
MRRMLRETAVTIFEPNVLADRTFATMCALKLGSELDLHGGQAGADPKKMTDPFPAEKRGEDAVVSRLLPHGRIVHSGEVLASAILAAEEEVAKPAERKEKAVPLWDVVRLRLLAGDEKLRAMLEEYLKTADDHESFVLETVVQTLRL